LKSESATRNMLFGRRKKKAVCRERLYVSSEEAKLLAP
jgi:hypothetical protein